MGLAACLLWSSTVAIARRLSEEIGGLTAAACSFTLAGLVGCAHAAASGRLRAMLRLPRAYLLGCGALFVLYIGCLYLGLGLAVSRQQALAVGVLNYLWPGLTLVFSVPLLGVRPRWPFALGVLAAVAGGALALVGPGACAPGALGVTLRAHPLPYLLGLAAGITWALHTVLARRTAGGDGGGAVPLFALATGLVLGGLRALHPEPARWSGPAVLAIIFMGLLPGLLAYSLWDRAVRAGNLTLLAALSYLIPILATLFGGLALHEPVAGTLWLACALVVGGAVICQVSLRR